eukprot:Transcript_30074.p2 GENE.Transcript_30074~~Transcript_30074.p2  ORF type:complete len:395 (-),score=89.34 Transcript_30074:119-1303(-)
MALCVDRAAVDRVLGLEVLQAWSSAIFAAKTVPGIASIWRTTASAHSERAKSEHSCARKDSGRAAPADAEPDFEFMRLDDVPALRDFSVSKRPIGAGGFGQVHCCCHKPTGRHFALKHMEKAQIVRLNQAPQVLSESATLSAVLHPFVANKFASLQTPSHVILVIEMCTGGDLFDVLKRDGHLKPSAVKTALCQLLLAIEHMHGCGIVHRDLKPENLLLDERGHTKLADFGFAKAVRFRTFTLCGTPAYMAPEVIMQRGHGRAVDFWALGAVLLELLCGKSPFAAPHAHASYQLVLQGTVAYPDTLPPHAEDLVSQLMQKQLSKRIGNLKGGFRDIKDHPFCEGLDWEHPHRLRVDVEARPFDRESHDWLPGEVVLAGRTPRIEAGEQSWFDTF